jgi:hypothetical protein
MFQQALSQVERVVRVVVLAVLQVEQRATPHQLALHKVTMAETVTAQEQVAVVVQAQLAQRQFHLHYQVQVAQD